MTVILMTGLTNESFLKDNQNASKLSTCFAATKIIVTFTSHLIQRNRNPCTMASTQSFFLSLWIHVLASILSYYFCC